MSSSNYNMHCAHIECSLGNCLECSGSPPSCEQCSVGFTLLSGGCGEYMYRHRNKSYHPLLERNGSDSGFVKSALCILKIDNKSLFLMSGHTGSFSKIANQS